MSIRDEVRQALSARLAELQRTQGALEAHLRNADRDLPADDADRAQAVQGDEVYEALEASGRVELEEIRHALVRLDSGEPLECESCGEPLDPRRLLALPTATTCVRCAAT
jgi:RNA polymerase-binding transcription factor DksA